MARDDSPISSGFAFAHYQLLMPVTQKSVEDLKQFLKKVGDSWQKLSKSVRWHASFANLETSLAINP